MKRALVQILVVVANIQMRTLKTEVEKGSMETAIGHGLVDPKPQHSCVGRGLSSESPVGRKGIGLTFPNQDVDTEW